MSAASAPGATPPRNGLLAALPPDEVERLRPHLHGVTLVSHQVLHEAGAPIDEVYFVQDGMVSHTADTGDNGVVEVGMTGREGAVGMQVLLDPAALSAHRAAVQVAGSAVRVRAAALLEAVRDAPVLRDRCLRHLQMLLVQASQGTACNARHELSERLARWLLMAHDRLGTDELPLQQELLAQMLGVRRAGVSAVAGGLQAQGLIRQSRGRVTVLDRVGLEARACNCYRFIEDIRRRIGGTPGQHAYDTVRSW